MGQFDPARLNTDPAVREAFVAAIGETGSLTAAAQATGVALSTAFRRRKRDAEFAARCEAALAQRRGWRLEAAMIDRATNGVVRERRYKDGSVERWVEFDHRLAIFLIGKLLPERYGPLAGMGAKAARPRMTRQEFLAVVEAQYPVPPAPSAVAA